MPFKIVFSDDKSVSLLEIPGTDINRIAHKYDKGWIEFLGAPAADLDAFVELVELAAGMCGADMPAHSTMRECLDLVNMIERLTDDDDDRPTEWNSHGIPLAEGD